MAELHCADACAITAGRQGSARTGILGPAGQAPRGWQQVTVTTLFALFDWGSMTATSGCRCRYILEVVSLLLVQWQLFMWQVYPGDASA
jgi:hypothetical protein